LIGNKHHYAQQQSTRGDNQLKSNENIKAIKLVPTSAPSIMMSAVDVRNIPCPTKELTIKKLRY
jgi:hypothetical protein